jgi:7-cyano-7-deazaguanine synthase
MSDASKTSVAPTAIVLLSGGLDSSANLALAIEAGHRPLALTVDYGQRAAVREAQQASRIAAYYGIVHQRVELPWLGALGGSSLTDPSRALPVLSRAELDEPEATKRSATAVWVPNRNGVLLQVAAAWAESLGAGSVLVGFNREEAATFPDNSQEFLERATAALALSTRTGVKVLCYTTALNKREIVARLRALPRPFPFELLWSCYEGGEHPCGRCESCGRLFRAQAEVS